ncbi:hypothetical protein TC41_1873 [Alicyclobacillus acidocaldarius subsp. acidocaldarius Tc-4-1]|uniref:Uncharacterized protein n=1 Tax=Alicyclobacillus acidocaldarius (strain Tc-4-1) TaxID=1048834 RepID=F8IDD7_ALIAT|nr:hypothetical protein TC41_1873 [Alicyclobacillus acidocaldarius subsp. acidocaldarius Tc-4-1]
MYFLLENSRSVPNLSWSNPGTWFLFLGFSLFSLLASILGALFTVVMFPLLLWIARWCVTCLKSAKSKLKRSKKKRHTNNEIGKTN